MMQPGEDVFTEADLEPTDDKRRSMRRALFDRALVAIATLAAGIWAGGLLALGTCAAPFVFRMTPYPFSGQAMGAAFGRFDGIAIGCSVVLLGCEVARTLLARRRRQGIATRVRRYLAILLGCAAVYGGMRLTPTIMRMHNEGVRRDVGARGAELEAVHSQAELIAKLILPGALALITLHVFTLGGALNDEEDFIANAPRPPGPRSRS